MDASAGTILGVRRKRGHRLKTIIMIVVLLWLIEEGIDIAKMLFDVMMLVFVIFVILKYFGG